MKSLQNTAFKKDGVPAPFNSMVELTRRCNERCRHCFNDVTPSQEIPIQAWKVTMDRLWELGCLELAFTGGEPLLYREFREILRYSWEKGFAITIFTNGTLLNDDLIEFLQGKVLKMEITIFSDRPEIHDAITRVRGSHARLLRNFRQLKKRGVRVVGKVPVLRLNSSRIGQLRKMLAGMGIPMHEDFSIVPTMGSKNRLRELQPGGNLLERWVASLPERKQRVCNAGRTTLYLSSEGDIYPCLFLRIKLGNITKDDLRRVWKNERYLAFIRSLRYEQFETCNRCAERRICKRCMGISLSMTGSLFRPYEGFCRLYKGHSTNGGVVHGKA